jgi:hypothetical protein
MLVLRQKPLKADILGFMILKKQYVTDTLNLTIEILPYFLEEINESLLNVLYDCVPDDIISTLDEV